MESTGLLADAESRGHAIASPLQTRLAPGGLIWQLLQKRPLLLNALPPCRSSLTPACGPPPLRAALCTRCCCSCSVPRSCVSCASSITASVSASANSAARCASACTIAVCAAEHFLSPVIVGVATAGTAGYPGGSLHRKLAVTPSAASRGRLRSSMSRVGGRHPASMCATASTAERAARRLSSE